MNRNSKLFSIVVAALAFALMLVLAGCGSQASSSAASASGSDSSASAAASSAASSAASDEVSFKLQVDATQADKGMLYDGVVTAKKGETVYAALIDTGLKLKVDTGSGSVFIDGIDDVVASEVSSNAGWLFTVNGEMPSVGADSLEVQDGDEIVWTFYPDFTKAMDQAA